MRLLAFCLLAPALLAGAALAAGEERKTGEDALICKANKATGSRIRVNKRCLTQADWNRLEAENRKDMDDILARSSRNQGGGSASAATGGPR